MSTYRWEDIHEGLTHSFHATFTDKMVQDYAFVSGAFNPLHVDKGYAQVDGLPGSVVFGQTTSTLYSQLAGMYLAGKLALCQGVDFDAIRVGFHGD
jgi:3-hydroxybutyryl-CoA dehydratase